MKELLRLLKNRFSVPLIVASFLFLLQSCQFETDPVAPRWDVEFSIPFANREYSIASIIERDTTNLKFASDTAIIYYGDGKDINPITVGADFELSPTVSTISAEIGNISVNQQSDISDNVDITRYLNVTPGQTQVVAGVENAGVIQDVPTLTAFEVAAFDAGTMNLRLTNNNGVPITINRIIIRSAQNYTFQGTTIVTNQRLLSRLDPVTLATGASQTVAFNLAGEKLVNNMKMELFISSPGSGGVAVSIPANAGTAYVVSFAGLSISAVRAVLPAQSPIVKTGSVVLDDSTQFTSATIESGSLRIALTNNIDIPLNVTINIPGLVSSSNQSFSRVVLVPRNGTAQVTENSLAGFRLVNSSLSNHLDYSVSSVNVVDGQPSTVSKDDVVEAEATISSLSVTRIEGRLKPTAMAVSTTILELDLADLENNFTFTQFNLAESDIRLLLRTSATVPANFSGKLVGTNSNGQRREMDIPPTLVTGGISTVKLDPALLQTFLAGFTQKLPGTLEFVGTAVLNPNYQIGGASINDSVYGVIDLKFPFNVGISGGLYRDTTELGIGSSDSSRIADAGQAEVYMIVENGIGAAIQVSGRVLNEKGQQIMNFPPVHSGSDSIIRINGGITDASGRVITARRDSLKFVMDASDFQKIIQGQNIVTTISINTSRTGNQPVKFYANDKIKVRFYGRILYTIDPSK
ncbi:MAG: hypothetical protein IAE91_13135 [Ignavibacteriaceae bacterium]|nr:hypothetical protein [Ignavibacteriaceae bacterium]